MAIQRQSATDFYRWLDERCNAHRIPVGGAIELTAQCNFGCIHCYLGDKRRDVPQMNTEMVISILRQSAQMGCLGVAFTGGEPLLRSDFKRIYRAAHQLGFWISLLTNGSLVDDSLIDLFKQHPPRAVEISLYGGDDDTYFHVTGKSGMFAVIKQNIDALRNAGIEVLLKVVLLKPVYETIEKIQVFAAERGLRVVFDPNVTPDLSQNGSPLDLRISPESAVKIEFSDDGQRQKLAEFCQTVRLTQWSVDDPVCGAGQRGFYVDSGGNMMGCALLREPCFSLLKMSLKDAWRLLGEVELSDFPNDSKCKTCSERFLCTYCPGAVACGDPLPKGEDSFYCRMVRARLNILK